MLPAPLVLALAAFAEPAHHARAPELVVLPLYGDGVDLRASHEAWEGVVRELSKSKRKIKIGMSLQRESHSVLLGPGREQATDCGTNIKCLAQIGRALGAAIVVAGKVSATRVSLVAMEVRSASKIGGTHSSSRLATRAVARKALAAGRGISNILLRYAQRSGLADVESSTEDSIESTIQGPTESTIDAPIEDRIDGSIEGSTGGAASSSTAAVLEAVPRLIQPAEPGPLTTGPLTTGPLTTGPLTTGPLTTGPLTTEPLTTEAARLEESVTSTWWFWTALGVALAAGTATTIALLDGVKGGPALPSDVGSVRGTY